MQAGGLMLVDNTGELQLMTSTSEAAGFVEVMQLNASAGPCIDCFRTGTAVSVEEISESARGPRSVPRRHSRVFGRCWQPP